MIVFLLLPGGGGYVLVEDCLQLQYAAQFKTKMTRHPTVPQDVACTPRVYTLWQKLRFDSSDRLAFYLRHNEATLVPYQHRICGDISLPFGSAHACTKIAVFPVGFITRTFKFTGVATLSSLQATPKMTILQ